MADKELLEPREAREPLVAPAASETGAASVALDEDADGTSDVHQYVTFVSGDEVFAVDMSPVQEIIRVPDVVRVPLAPAALDGLANLRGRVLPIVSLRRVFGFDERVSDDASRALVIDLGQPLGFVVDRVVSVVGVESAKVEPVTELAGTVNAEMLSGILKDVGGHPMIMVLDFAKLIASEFSDIAAMTRRSGVATVTSTASDDVADDETTDELHLVSFQVAGQEYAIPISDVKEIVQVPETIIHVPHAESHVVGIMTLRQRLLPLVSLRTMFGLPPQDPSEQSRIVVVALGESLVGIVMDTVNEVLRVPRALVDAMPSLLNRAGDLGDIAQICRLDDGERMVSIISAATLFRHSAIQSAITTVRTEGSAVAQDEVSDDEVLDDDEQVVVFRLGKEEFGVPIESVQEIVRVPDELTVVPRAPSFVLGVINLRGAVLPVVDLRRRLGLADVERSDRQRIMVFLINGLRTGFVVDSVAEVLKIQKSVIEPAPKLSTAQETLLSRMANLQKDKRMVQLLSPEHLMTDGDAAELAGMAA